MDLSFWWLFPTAIVTAAVANGEGMGGAPFFSPLFVIGDHLRDVNRPSAYSARRRGTGSRKERQCV